MCDLNTNNVISWEGRPKRSTKAPVTYWTEYVETDQWYLQELVSDVPKAELYAACECEDFESETSEVMETEVDDDYSEEEEEEEDEEDVEDEEEDSEEEVDDEP